ncbi:RING-H2 finger protein ATL44-like [Gossypium australe]|uniref:RING-H2 finger protein ATL44-like n=1 Tax=Gossypium australe TaxID=47621 RepID=A0A5B6U3S3_9ROSI|nr:RING-H2 finger protein ATL44-like [Gossypium australe]
MAIDKLGKYLVSILSMVSVVKWAWNLLLRYCLFPYQIPAPIGGEDFKLGCRNYSCKQDAGDEEEEEVECAICLCKIDEDDEIPELRCDHVFHKVCLDRWVGYRRSTCPLCRTSLTAPRQLVSGMEVLLFKYCCLDDGRQRETWWLR